MIVAELAVVAVTFTPLSTGTPAAGAVVVNVKSPLDAVFPLPSSETTWK
jgi:hypothetical protein